MIITAQTIQQMLELRGEFKRGAEKLPEQDIIGHFAVSATLIQKSLSLVLGWIAQPLHECEVIAFGCQTFDALRYIVNMM